MKPAHELHSLPDFKKQPWSNPKTEVEKQQSTNRLKIWCFLAASEGIGLHLNIKNYFLIIKRENNVMKFAQDVCELDQEKRMVNKTWWK